MNVAKFFVLMVLILGLTIPRSIWHFALHIPTYITHFQYHCAEEGPIDFIDFIAMHTGSPNHEHKDKGAHDNLPIQHSHVLDFGKLLTIFPFPETAGICLFLKPLSVTKMALQQLFLSPGFFKLIWQPPRIS